jgi:FlaA1/EpsC-like NDP-sugar epimerase
MENPMRRVFIYGAGEAGVMVLNEIQRHPEEGIEVIGFFDDDRKKIGSYIQGVMVHGGKSELKWYIRSLDVNEVIIAMPSTTKNVIKEIVKICKNEKVKLLIVPSTLEIIEGVVRFDQIKQLDLADLFDREEVRVESEDIRSYIQDRRILITGAAGSIGSELVRKVMKYSPHMVMALDINENGLFYLVQDTSLNNIIPCVADIKDAHILNDLFSTYQPDIVFHAAAYKHVPLMENHIRVIFINNVIGTRNLLDVSLSHAVRKFIGISTDKAVYPVSVMGKTKRICELLVNVYSKMGLESCSVRFGNVLGSNGSVLTVFQDQIRRGGPITITSPFMQRYFMTIYEATSLVLQAGSMGGDGNIYVLDMGEPIKIKDLAESIIILSGLAPGTDIKIDYTGVRAGEKFSEELFHREADVYESRYKGIYIEKTSADTEHVLRRLDNLIRDVYLLDGDEIKEAMDTLINTRKKVSV